MLPTRKDAGLVFSVDRLTVPRCRPERTIIDDGQIAISYAEYTAAVSGTLGSLKVG